MMVFSNLGGLLKRQYAAKNKQRQRSHQGLKNKPQRKGLLARRMLKKGIR